MLTKEGRLLKERRAANNLEQKELAKLASTAQSQISRIERGQVRPSIKTLEKLFTAMGEELELMIKKSRPPQKIATKRVAHQGSLMYGPLVRPKKQAPKRKSKKG